MENIRRYFRRTDKTYLLLCIFSSVMAVTALSSWAAKQGNGFAVDEITGQITGLGDYRRAAVQAGAALIGLVIAVLLSNIDYRSLVKVVADGAPLLHFPDPLAEQLVLSLLPLLGVRQFGFRLRNIWKK